MKDDSEPLVAVTVFLSPDVGAKVKRASLQAQTTSPRLLEAFITNEFKSADKVRKAVEVAKKAAPAG